MQKKTLTVMEAPLILAPEHIETMSKRALSTVVVKSSLSANRGTGSFLDLLAIHVHFDAF